MAFKHTDPTLEKVKENEPIFILRGQDVTAPLVVLDWIRANFHSAPPDKLREAFECAMQMERFYFKKLPD